MECQASDSKKLFKVFDASKLKRTRKKHDGDDSNSQATDDSNCGNVRRINSAKASLQEILPAKTNDGNQDVKHKRDRDGSPSPTRPPPDAHRPRSPRRHRRIAREGISLALKAGLVSTPRSMSPNPQEMDDQISSVPKDQDSFIYAFLEEAIKRDKKKQRHSRRQDEHRTSRDRDVSASRDHRHHHHHHRRHKETAREQEKSTKEESPVADQTALFETFAKLCAKMNEKTALCSAAVNNVPRSHSHKSLQCEVVSHRDLLDDGQRPIRHYSRDNSRDRYSPTRIRSHEHCTNRIRSHNNIAVPTEPRNEKCICCDPYDKPKFSSKMNVPSKVYDDERYRVYPPDCAPTRTCLTGKYRPGPERRDIRTYEGRAIKKYDDRRPCEQKASRSFDMHRDRYNEEDRSFHRTARSDGIKDKSYDDREYVRDGRYDERNRSNKYYDVPERNFPNLTAKARRSRRNLEKFERASVASRDEDYRDRYSERERDSGLSVADGETSTISGKSNYLRVVKQEISEQREAMDKMMKLWKELMRCFKGVSQTQSSNKNADESNIRESAAEQLRLWRECMRRYETVARDVGDTDARLMEEINKQRSEMSEMANMWQECLQRYRDMSNDFNNLKQQLATSESPSRAAPPVCAEGEGPPAAPYRLPPTYPPVPQMAGYMGGSPLRTRASAPPGPPAWWWSPEGHRSPHRRRSSPDSRGSRERRHRHKDRDRDEPRYKEKSKPSGARSEHRHRKR